MDEAIRQLRRRPQPRHRPRLVHRSRSRTCSSASSRRSSTRPATSVARRFGYAYVDSFGTVTPAGPAPYLDCVAAPDGPAVDAARSLPWLADAEDKATSWIIANQLPEYLAEVQPRRAAELQQGPRPGRRKRLDAGERAAAARRGGRLGEGAGGREAQGVLRQPEPQGGRTRRPAAQAPRRCSTSSSSMSTKPPRIVTAALVLPLGMLEGEIPATAPIHAKETKEVERRGVDLVLAPSASSAASPSSRRSTTPASTSCPPTPTGDTYPDRGQGPDRRRRGLLRHPQRGDDRQERRPALPPRARAGRSARGPSTTRSATSTTVRGYRPRRLRRHRRSAATGTRPGPRRGSGSRSDVAHGIIRRVERTIAVGHEVETCRSAS